jgi:hypothetical protein
VHEYSLIYSAPSGCGTKESTPGGTATQLRNQSVSSQRGRDCYKTTSGGSLVFRGVWYRVPGVTDIPKQFGQMKVAEIALHNAGLFWGPHSQHRPREAPPKGCPEIFKILASKTQFSGAQKRNFGQG